MVANHPKVQLIQKVSLVRVYIICKRKRTPLFTMNIAEAKAINLVAFLKTIGFKPKKVIGQQYWYNSPLRSENTASFKVDNKKNLWYDFGLGQGGDIINFAKFFYNTIDTPTALAKIADEEGAPHPVAEAPHQTIYKDKASMNHIEMKPLSNFALLSYLESRGIDKNVGQKYCKEIHYQLRDKHYYGIAFLNISGGTEIRNPYYKGCIGNKNVTIISERPDAPYIDCCVFEGFMDFLSYQTLMMRQDQNVCIDRPYDCLIMNSVCNLVPTIKHLEKYEHIHCFLDNDKAGQVATESILGIYGTKVINESSRYADYKDVNDYLMDKRL